MLHNTWATALWYLQGVRESLPCLCCSIYRNVNIVRRAPDVRHYLDSIVLQGAMSIACGTIGPERTKRLIINYIGENGWCNFHWCPVTNDVKYLRHLETQWRIVWHLEIQWQSVRHLEIQWQSVRHLEIHGQSVEHLEIQWHSVQHLEIQWQSVQHLEIQWPSVNSCNNPKHPTKQIQIVYTRVS